MTVCQTNLGTTYAEPWHFKKEKKIRLINADRLRKWILANWHNITLYDVLDQIDREDTYDVVRCKDCVYAKPFNKVWQLPIEDALVCTNFGNEKVDEDFFCGCAIKKMDEVEE